MAYAITDKENTLPPGAGQYPFGQIKDRAGGAPGTPVDTKVYGDFHQFFAKIMDSSGVDFNHSPDGIQVVPPEGGDAVLTFQYYDALDRLIKNSVGTSYRARENNAESGEIRYAHFATISFDSSELSTLESVCKALTMNCSVKALDGNNDISFPLISIATVKGNGTEEPIVFFDFRITYDFLYRSGDSISKFLFFTIDRSSTEVYIKMYWKHIDPGFFSFTLTHLFVEGSEGDTSKRYKGINFINDSITSSVPTGWTTGLAESYLSYLDNVDQVNNIEEKTIGEDVIKLEDTDFTVSSDFNIQLNYPSFARLINEKTLAINTRVRIGIVGSGEFLIGTYSIANNIFESIADFSNFTCPTTLVVDNGVSSRDYFVAYALLAKTGDTLRVDVTFSTPGGPLSLNNGDFFDSSLNLSLNDFTLIE